MHFDEPFDGQFIVGGHVEDGGVVDQKIEPAMLALDRGGKRRYRAIVRDVDVGGGRAIQLGSGRLRLGLVDVGDPDNSAFARKPPGDGLADATTGPGHQCHPVHELSVHPVPRSVRSMRRCPQRGSVLRFNDKAWSIYGSTTPWSTRQPLARHRLTPVKSDVYFIVTLDEREPGVGSDAVQGTMTNWASRSRLCTAR